MSVFSGNYQPDPRQTDLICSSLIASNHLSLDSDSRRVSNRKHFGRNTGPTCPWARDIKLREGERGDAEDLWEKLIHLILWKLLKVSLWGETLQSEPGIVSGFHWYADLRFFDEYLFFLTIFTVFYLPVMNTSENSNCFSLSFWFMLNTLHLSPLFHSVLFIFKKSSSKAKKDPSYIHLCYIQDDMVYWVTIFWESKN